MAPRDMTMMTHGFVLMPFPQRLAIAKHALPPLVFILAGNLLSDSGALPAFQLNQDVFAFQKPPSPPPFPIGIIDGALWPMMNGFQPEDEEEDECAALRGAGQREARGVLTQ